VRKPRLKRGEELSVVNAVSKVGIHEDPVKAALQVMLTLSKAFQLVKSECEKLDETVIPKRLEDFSSLVPQVGLIPAITFFLSKIDEEGKVNAYEATLKAIREPDKQPDKAICNDLSGAGGGYPHALALLLAYIAERAGCSDASYETIQPDLVNCLEKIESQSTLIEKFTLSYAYELKKLAKALYREKE